MVNTYPFNRGLSMAKQAEKNKWYQEQDFQGSEK